MNDDEIHREKGEQVGCIRIDGVDYYDEHFCRALLARSDAAEAERDEAVLAEREACAQVVEQIRDERCATCGHPRSEHHYRHLFVSTGGTMDAAAAIRART